MIQNVKVLLIVFLALPVGLRAQEQVGQSFTLEQCIQYAMEHTVNVQNARIDEQIAQAKVRETVGLGLPQITGSASVVHNGKLPRFFAQYQTAQGFGGVDENGDPLLTIPGLAATDVVAANNFFQLRNSGDANIGINQLLFNSSYLVGLKAASTYKELSYKTTEQTAITVIESVTKAYYSVLVNNERVTLFDSNIARVDSLLQNTTALNKNGFAESIDVDRIRVSLNNLKSERLKFINLQSLNLGLLKFQMNYPMDQQINVAGSISDLTIDENLFADYGQGWDYKNRIEFKILDTQKRLQELDLKNKYSNSLPSLSGFATLGLSTQSGTFSGLFKTESNFSENAFAGPDKWYGYNLIGLRLNVPIFSGLQRHYQVQQSKLALLKLQNNYSSLKQNIDLNIEQNTIQYKNAVESLGSQKENMELAQRVARVTKIKYEQGVGSNLEVTEAESSLREAQVNYYNAVYDALVAKIDIDKAYGKIDGTSYNTSK